MPQSIKEQVTARLRQFSLPGSSSDIVTAGLVSDVFVNDGRVVFSISVPADQARTLEPFRVEVERQIKAIAGVEKAMVALTAEVKEGAQPAAAPRGKPAQKAGLPGVKSIIAVASGKGGVGKSTTAVNLALGLSANGLKVGILDADIYGPSVPRLTQLSGQPDVLDGKILVPKENYGLKVMSIGFLVDEDVPMIWRGPMVVSALTQMLRECAWGELDVLIVDMPPGTGDAQLTMAQQVPLSGAVIVSTPQDLALIDARRGVAMFQKVEVPVIGIIENMSYFLCPHCGGRSDVFGHGGARHDAERLGVPFLGEVPLQLRIRESSDAGTPLVVTEPESAEAGIYREIARKVWEQVTGTPRRAAPRIVID